ncbi:MAG TPA: hypothetical protein VFU19_12340 [Iamia sp.]|nr:hypothetical protein [Iamia sp.]
MSKLAKAGVAKKLVEEAKKPQNQAKAKELFRKVRQKQSGARPR